MNLIFISTDKNIAKESSDVRKRMEHYGTLVEEIEILLLGASIQGQSKISPRVTLHGISGNKWQSVWKAFWLAKKLSRPKKSLKKAETVIVAQDPFELGFLGWIVSSISGSPLNVQVHIDFFSPYFKSESFRQRFQSWLASFVLKRADSIRVVSAKIASYLVEKLGLPPSKIVIAPVFVDIDALRARPVTIDLHREYPEFEWIVLTASRFVKQKNIPLGVEAFDLFRKSHPKTGLIIVGSGPEIDTIKKVVRSKDLGSSVRIGSWPNEFASCMKSSDAFLLSSDYEGWGMTVIEAAALGKPIIMTDVGCAGEFLIHEKNGLIVQTRDPQAIQGALEKLYSNRAYAKNMAMAADRGATTYMSREENDQLLLQSWKNTLDADK
jgi:glycosyltransferase involved in cell wall biosynthesis